MLSSYVFVRPIFSPFIPLLSRSSASTYPYRMFTPPLTIPTQRYKVRQNLEGLANALDSEEAAGPGGAMAAAAAAAAAVSEGEPEPEAELEAEAQTQAQAERGEGEDGGAQGNIETF